MTIITELFNELAGLEEERCKVLWPLARELESLEDQERELRRWGNWSLGMDDEGKKERQVVRRKIIEKRSEYATHRKEFSQREKSLRQQISDLVLAAGETQQGDNFEAVYVKAYIVIRRKKEKQP